MLQYQCSVAFDSRVDLGCGGAALSKPKPNLPKSSQTLTKSAQKKSKKMTLISLAILSFFNELWRPLGQKIFLCSWGGRGLGAVGHSVSACDLQSIYLSHMDASAGRSPSPEKQNMISTDSVLWQSIAT
jgi:hypothetical protein